MQLRKIKPKKTVSLETRGQRVGLVVASLLLGLIKTMDKKQQHKQTTIRYCDYMRASTNRVKGSDDVRKKLALICRDAMLLMVEKHKDEKSIMEVGTFTESMSFSFEKELTEFCGDNYMELMSDFVLKQAFSGDVKESYQLADELRDNIRELIFERIVKDND